MVDEALILRYFTGEITAEERSNVEKWISESEQNRKLAKDIYYLYFAVDTLYTMKSVDSMQALKNVKRERQKERPEPFLHGFNVLQQFFLFHCY